MKKLLAAIFSIIAGVAFAAAAFATSADAATSAINSGFYVGAQGGVAIPDDNVNTGFDVGGRAGYRFGNGFRVEEAFNYFRQSVDLGPLNTNLDAHLNTYTLMTNGYYDFNTGTKFIPYLGAGIGLAHDSLTISDDNNSLSVSNISGSHSHFAAQGIAGVGYQFTRNVGVDVQYRYLYTDKTVGNQNNTIIEAGLNYYFST
ncbi:MAG: hypothetical protein A3F67_08175 [Verrucomicrobia bacterium RIFCSPHIGHO2_12_FULL_41_10]|nr:MAG: hypothetical protein A3F67_08175 [Verrucomicrobia bacterium RIFCSPHIGHO2_12_FULL_41_10]